MLPILERVTSALAESPGTVMVAGHTDDVPIKSQTFGSNWELATDRAVSVVHQIIELGNLSPNRIRAMGYGDTRPLAPNDTAENRALNRRVEIVIEREVLE